MTYFSNQFSHLSLSYTVCSSQITFFFSSSLKVPTSLSSLDLCVCYFFWNFLLTLVMLPRPINPSGTNLKVFSSEKFFFWPSPTLDLAPPPCSFTQWHTHHLVSYTLIIITVNLYQRMSSIRGFVTAVYPCLEQYRTYSKYAVNIFN